MFGQGFFTILPALFTDDMDRAQADDKMAAIQ